jgi:NADH dehydrogenase
MKNTNSKTFKVVIAGAGFAGLAAAQTLIKKLPARANIKIMLIDKSDRHLYTPDLYEVAAAFKDEISDKCENSLSDAVAPKIDELINSKKIEFLQDEALKVYPRSQRVLTKKEGFIKYDKLIFALGSEQNFYNIKGLKQFSYPVKTANDALVINCHLDSFFCYLWKKKSKDDVFITIGGGGPTGCEFAAEMVSYLNLLSKKYDFPRDKIVLQLLQASDLIGGFDKKISDLTKRRLKSLGVRILTNHRLVEAKPNAIKAHISGQNGLQIDEIDLRSDVLIWTGGVKKSSVLDESFAEFNYPNPSAVDESLRSKYFKNIYFVGDSAELINKKTAQAVPMMAQAAWEQGELAAKNICRELKGEKPQEFKIKNYSLIMPLGGKWGICHIGKKIITGFPAYIIRRASDLLYNMRIMPFRKALSKWRKENHIYHLND